MGGGFLKTTRSILAGFGVSGILAFFFATLPLLAQTAPDTKPASPGFVSGSPFKSASSDRFVAEPRKNAPSVPVTVPELPALRDFNPRESTGQDDKPLTHDALQQALQAKEKAAKAEAAAQAKTAQEKANTDKKQKSDQKPTAATTTSTQAGSDGQSPAPTDPALPASPQAMFNGSFTQSVPIEVPTFRGHEPKLKLVYDSNHGTNAGGHNAGWIGVGWHLEGISEIVRVSRRRGAPKFDATDTWTLDGEELIACATGVESPSCQTGGSHATRVESYRRIAYNSSDNRWKVTRTDGSYDLYVPVGAFVNSGTPSTSHSYTYRYVLQKSADTNGNEVVFGYTCQILPACIPSTISYGPYSIVFHSDTRPDPADMAVGGALMTVDRRLRTIDVVAYGSRTRAYQLNYDQSPATGASRLISVRQFGKNATLNGSGIVAGGDAMPPYVFTYQGNTIATSVASQGFNAPVGYFNPWTASGDPHTTVIHPDRNGDGRDDILAIQGTPSSIAGEPPSITYTTRHALSEGSSYHNQVNSIFTISGNILYQQFLNGDFFGTGKQETMLVYTEQLQTPGDDASWYYVTRIGSVINGGIFTPLFSSSPHLVVAPYFNAFLTGDFDGDGKTENSFRIKN